MVGRMKKVIYMLSILALIMSCSNDDDPNNGPLVEPVDREGFFEGSLSGFSSGELDLIVEISGTSISSMSARSESGSLPEIHNITIEESGEFKADDGTYCYKGKITKDEITGEWGLVDINIGERFIGSFTAQKQ